jgi:hypothetical protein
VTRVVLCAAGFRDLGKSERRGFLRWRPVMIGSTGSKVQRGFTGIPRTADRKSGGLGFEPNRLRRLGNRADATGRSLKTSRAVTQHETESKTAWLPNREMPSGGRLDGRLIGHHLSVLHDL